MGNQNQNGRNVAIPDENRPSWRPDDQPTRARDDDDDRGRSWRDRDHREADRMMSDRDHGDRGDRGRLARSQVESRWNDDRDEGYRMSDRYGQGQSGYAAGRQADDRSMQGYQNRNQGYAGRYEDRQHGEHLDDRFTGRGGQGYWQDRGYHSGYNQGGPGNPDAIGGSQQGGFGGYGSSEQGRPGFGAQGFGAQGVPQGHSGGYGAQGGSSGGRSGQYGQGHQGLDQPGGYDPQRGMQGGGQRGSWGQEPQRQPYGLHRGKGPQGYQRSDERIRELVCEALTDDDQIDATTIEVAVKSGEVILSGTVPDRQTKRMAEDVVERCAGVKDVQNQIKVSMDPTSSRGTPETSSRGAHEASSRGTPEASHGTDKKHRA